MGSHPQTHGVCSLAKSKSHSLHPSSSWPGTVNHGQHITSFPDVFLLILIVSESLSMYSAVDLFKQFQTYVHYFAGDYNIKGKTEPESKTNPVSCRDGSLHEGHLFHV